MYSPPPYPHLYNMNTCLQKVQYFLFSQSVETRHAGRVTCSAISQENALYILCTILGD